MQIIKKLVNETISNTKLEEFIKEAERETSYRLREIFESDNEITKDYVNETARARVTQIQRALDTEGR